MKTIYKFVLANQCSMAYIGKSVVILTLMHVLQRALI